MTSTRDTGNIEDGVQDGIEDGVQDGLDGGVQDGIDGGVQDGIDDALRYDKWTSPAHLRRYKTIRRQMIWLPEVLSHPLGNVLTDDIYAAAVRHPTYDVALMAEIIEKLPHLRVLHVQHVYFHQSYFPISPALPRSLQRFEYIANISPVPEMGQPLAALLSLFSDIKVLYLYGLRFSPMEPNTMSRRPDLRYETLHLIKSSDFDMFARMFRSVLVSGTTETLTLNYWEDNSSDFSADKELWRAVSPSLLNAIFIFNVGLHHNPDIYKFDVSRCTHLRSMVLEIVLSPEDYTRDEHTWVAVMQMLSRLLACPHLCQVTVRTIMHSQLIFAVAQLHAQPENHI
ncbi:hypothetical protein NM688_g5509 [Phlebia brevispora]|uniref:Uncharacterized protein n=1 Tax=Phlebia brevispora TaxID=194682 RepID=A0ACC1SU91_9APHY|nr:hypothetical protein NM688_g5509 [Phlebia brevispora]